MASTYRELAPPPGLEEHVACVWASHDRAVRVLPDGCADVLFTAGHLIVAGPATEPVEALATPGLERFGVRFRIGSAGAALGVPALELRDQGVPLAELWGPAGRRLEDRVAAAPTTEEALAALVRGVAERLPAAGAGDPLVRGAALALTRGASLGEAGRAVGLGERQLRRRFERAVGYGPATLVRVHRFQRFLLLAEREPAAPLARLAADAGYADQAHLIRECRRLSGLPPAALLAAGAAAAGDRPAWGRPARSWPAAGAEKSDPFNSRRPGSATLAA